jgi:catechol 2,3-dioxygenase-like lactoylglutathione lyase family enzyme
MNPAGDQATRTRLGDGLHHVCIRAEELAAAGEFVSRVLGFEPDGSFEEPNREVKVAFWRNGHAQLEFVELTDPAAKLEGRAASLDHIAFQIEDANTVHAAIQSAGRR